jgi:hypothetical protein
MTIILYNAKPEHITCPNCLQHGLWRQNQYKERILITKCIQCTEENGWLNKCGRNTNGALFNKPLTDEQLIKWAIWLFIFVRGKKYYFIKDKLPYRLGYIYNKIYIQYKNNEIKTNDLIWWSKY